MITITLMYAGLLGLLMALLSIRVPMRRLKLDQPWGDGGDSVLATRIRVFGNFIEYVPAILLLMALLEASGAAALFLHFAGAGLCVSRVIHALSLAQGEVPAWRRAGRAAGAMSTWLILTACAGYALVLTL